MVFLCMMPVTKDGRNFGLLSQIVVNSGKLWYNSGKILPSSSFRPSLCKILTLTRKNLPNLQKFGPNSVQKMAYLRFDNDLTQISGKRLFALDVKVHKKDPASSVSRA